MLASLNAIGVMRMGAFLRVLYTILFYLSIPFVILRLMWRSRRAPAYAKRLMERFAHFDTPNYSHSIWLHAVSMGEFMAATALIKALKQAYPDVPLVITTTTPTGSERVQTLLGDSVFHVYAPYDLPSVVHRFLNKTNPLVAIIMETELWPNILQGCASRNIPVFIANARLSPKSAKGYKKIMPLSRYMCQRISRVGAQTKSDLDRFVSIGMSRDHVQITGNLKFDQKIPQSVEEIAGQLKKQWGVSRPVWVAASTHEGEEQIILAAHRVILQTIPDALLLIVPRHPERFVSVFSLTQKMEFLSARRSCNDVNMQTQVLVGDTMGEMMSFYAAADLAFVGGSLVPIGGHNLLEPAAIGLATLTGPHVFNMHDVTHAMIERGATKWVHNTEELQNKVLQLLQDGPLRCHMGEIAQKIIADNQGAVDNHIAVIDQLLIGVDIQAKNDPVW